MKNIFYFILLTILIACSPKNKVTEVKNEDGAVIHRFSENVETGQKEGKSETFSNGGLLLETSSYKNGQLHGERTLYHENGEIQAIEQYENGAFKGRYQAFYENKQLELEGKYIDGKMDGAWKRYYDSGELMEIVNFVANEENGPFVEYYKNGQKKTEGSYLNGDNEHGELLMYTQNGELEKKMNCEKGICRTSWTKEQNEKRI